MMKKISTIREEVGFGRITLATVLACLLIIGAFAPSALQAQDPEKEIRFEWVPTAAQNDD